MIQQQWHQKVHYHEGERQYAAGNADYGYHAGGWDPNQVHSYYELIELIIQ